MLAASGAHPATIDVAELSGLQAQVSAGQDFNEHVWYSLPTIKKLTDTLAVDLARADPTHAGLFTTNASAFDTRLDTLTAKLTTIKARHGGARVAITEPVPLYLVQAAGLVNATAPEFSKAIEDGTDPSASVLSATLATFDDARRNSPVLLSEIPHPGNEGDRRSLTLVVSCASAACRVVTARWARSAISRASPACGGVGAGVLIGDPGEQLGLVGQ